MTMTENSLVTLVMHGESWVLVLGHAFSVFGYESLSAAIGSTRDALSAGTSADSAATAPSIAGADK